MTRRKTKKWIGTAFALNAVYCGGALAADNLVVNSGETVINDSPSYPGGTQISSGGTLVIGSDAGSGASLGSDVVAGSGATLAGFGAVAGNVTLNAGSHIAPGYAVGTDTGVSNGTLSVGGNLSLNGANVDFETGFAGTPITQPGTGDNIAVAGNLSIASSTVNVAVNVGGSNAGLYRLFQYGGTLTETGSGLTVGTVTATTSPDAAPIIQTLTADKQINVLLGGGQLVNLWNGDGLASSAKAGGGSGTWTATSSTFTNFDASLAGPLQPGGFAIFTGAPGTVTVSNSAGAVQASGVQFASDHYTLQGDPLTLVANGGNQPAIVVGDGTFAAGPWVERIDNPLAGTSGFVKTGVGSLILTGDSSALSGPILIADGALEIDGKLNGPLSIGREVVLAGIGQVGTTTLFPTAVVAPGNDANPIGTLTVNGDMSFAAGTQYRVNTDPTSAATDLIHVTGQANLAGSVMHVGQDGNYAPLRTYTILTADGGVNGRFDSVSSNYTFLNPSLTYDTHDAFLTLTRNDVPLSSAAGNGNAGAAGGALDGALPPATGSSTPAGTTGSSATATAGSAAGTSVAVTSTGSTAGAPIGSGAATVAGAVATLSPAQATVALNELSGEVHGSSVSVMQGIGDTVRTLPMDHLRANLDAAPLPGPATAQLGLGQASALPRSDDHPVWAQAFGNWRTYNGDGNASRVNESDGGLFVGADHAIGNGWRLGGALGYTGSHTTISGLDSRADIDSYSATIFGGKNFDAGPGKIRLTAGTAFTWHDARTRRTVNVGSLDQTLKADYNASTTQVFSELGYAVPLGDRYTIEPFAGVAYSHLNVHGFSETGGSAALDGQGQNNNVTTTTLGLRGESTFEINQKQGHLRAMLGWRHAMGDVRPQTTLAFDGGQDFTVTGAPIAHNAAVMGLGADLQITKNATIGVFYTGQVGGGNRQNAALVNVAWRF